MANHILMKNQSGDSVLDQLEAPEFSSADHAGWEGLGVEASGVFLFMFRIEAGAVDFPLHDSPDAWLGYVVSGSGTLHAGSADGKLMDSVAYQAGDFITFEPNTQHGWSNGGEPSKIMFVKVAG